MTISTYRERERHVAVDYMENSSFNLVKKYKDIKFQRNLSISTNLEVDN